MPILLLLLACDGGERPLPKGDDTGATSTPTATTPPSWDAAGPSLPCDAGGSADLLESALGDAELDRADFGYHESEWDDWRSIAADDFEFSWFAEVHHVPEQFPCFGRQVGSDLDTAVAAAHPAAATLGAFAPWVDVVPSGEPIDPSGLDPQSALDGLLAVAGGGCTVDGLDAELATALAPVFVGLAEVITVRVELDAAADGRFTVKELYNGAPATVLYGKDPVPDVSDADGLRWFTRWYTGEDGPKRLVDPARRLAFAIEHADLGRFAGGATDWSCATDRGVVRVSPSTDDSWGADELHLFHLELGGNDTYTGPAGATADKDQAVGVLVDLGGDDTYAYVEVPIEQDAPGTLPSDDDGRVRANGYWISESDHPRQGAGRYGVGLLFDLGAGTDHYRSLRMSQGFGALGVGLLLDDGGDDLYEGEAGVQGSGVFGWGALVDLGGGADTYRTWAQSQGFAYVHSGGVLHDDGGDDVYWGDPGNDYGGVTLYYSPQLASGQGNSSFVQGAGLGMRADSYDVYLSGGLGLLRDGGGSDSYTAGVFSQATGYWKGFGVLADAAGDDTYNALWYIQGGAAHFAMALLMDGAGDDLYNPDFVPYNVSLGSGHDFSVGVAIDESGDDVIRSTSLGLGASNCQGIGVWADNAGNDTYLETSTYSVGLGNQSGECNEATGRTVYRSIGIFVDAGGTDAYTWVEGDVRTPADDSAFGWEANGSSTEHGGAVDGSGASGFRVTTP